LARDYPERLLLGAQASWDDILLVHDRRYVSAVQEGTLSDAAVRRLGFPREAWGRTPSAELQFGEGPLVLRARRSVGGTLAALAWAMQDGAAGHLAGGTHHAFRDRGEGFCVFNDIAVAIAVARRDHGVRRAAVVDLDVHQGNGTASICEGDAGVFTLSLHGAHNYPFRKETSSHDVPLPDGCDDATYLAALDGALERVRAHRPDLLIYQSGVDGLAGDRLGRMALTRAGLRARNTRVYALARQLGVPLVVTLGGGYHRAIEVSMEAHADVYLGLVAELG
jgi:acetoin utilization deacetylase AcuC-like enzyme